MMTRPASMSRRPACAWLGAWLLACALPAAAQGIATVEVFANSAMPITPASGDGLPFKLDVYRLDAMQNVEHLINQSLPQTEAEAMAWVKANEARLRRQLQPMVVSSAHGITLAAGYRLQRLPAIVINRQTVVYGVTDVQQAIALAQRERGGRP